MHIGRKLYLGMGVGAAGLIAALAVIVTGVLTSEPLHAAGANPCSLKTIKGTWIYDARGVVRDGQKVLPYAEAGNWTLDGAGNAFGIFSAAVDGVIVANQEAFTATYQMKPGCVFTALAPVGGQTVEFHLYPTEKGATMAYFSPGVSGTQYRQ